MDCSLPGSSVHGISQARILEWVAISFSKGSSQPGIELMSPVSPALQVDSLDPLSHGGSPQLKNVSSGMILRDPEPHPPPLQLVPGTSPAMSPLGGSEEEDEALDL